MGVEPTAARAERPAADFEDREAHRDSYTPTQTIAQDRAHCQHVGRSQQPRPIARTWHALVPLAARDAQRIQAFEEV